MPAQTQEQLQRSLTMPNPLPHGFRLVEGSLYCVDASGTVMSCRKRFGGFVPWYSLSPGLGGNVANRSRHLFVVFHKDGTRKIKLVHRLVLEAFVGPCPDGMEACHNDGNSLNNSVSNLRWDTHKANQRDRVIHGTDNCGEKSPLSKLSNEKVLKIRALREVGMDYTKIGKIFGIHKGTARRICLKERWAHLTNK